MLRMLFTIIAATCSIIQSADAQYGWTRSGAYWVPNQMISQLPPQAQAYYYPNYQQYNYQQYNYQPGFYQSTHAHADGQGFTVRQGNIVQSYRNDGTIQSYLHDGSVTYYSDTAGTTGESRYSHAGRYDSYQNANRNWKGQGFSPYGSSDSSYSRQYGYTPRKYP